MSHMWDVAVLPTQAVIRGGLSVAVRYLAVGPRVNGSPGATRASRFTIDNCPENGYS